jgi:alkaline phosphatase D
MDFADERSATIAAELTNTSLSSNGDGSDLPAQWDRIAPLNPHIKYASNRRGYLACTATPGALQTEFKVIEKVTVPGQPVTTGATLVVEAGRPGLQS